jgi:FkbM family methyltransferase
MNNIWQWIGNNVDKNGVVIEAGVCTGEDTLRFSHHLSGGKVYGFEPIKYFFDIAYSINKSRPNVELYHMALSDTTGVSEMWFADRFGQPWGSGSLRNPKEHLRTNPEISFKHKEIVTCINLDEWVKSKKIDYIEMMWLDMQGSEPDVLKASTDVLKITKYLYSEVSTVENYEGQTTYEDFKSFLSSHGFEVVEEGLYWADGGNTLFKNKNLVLS